MRAHPAILWLAAFRPGETDMGLKWNGRFFLRASDGPRISCPPALQHPSVMVLCRPARRWHLVCCPGAGTAVGDVLHCAARARRERGMQSRRRTGVTVANRRPRRALVGHPRYPLAGRPEDRRCTRSHGLFGPPTWRPPWRILALQERRAQELREQLLREAVVACFRCWYESCPNPIHATIGHRASPERAVKPYTGADTTHRRAFRT